MITLLSVYTESYIDNVDSIITLLFTVNVSAKFVILPTDKESLIITLLSVYNVSCKDSIDAMVVSPSMITLL